MENHIIQSFLLIFYTIICTRPLYAQDQCSWDGTLDRNQNGQNLIMYFNSKSQSISLQNCSAESAILLDYENERAAIADGKGGLTILELSNAEGCKIKSGNWDSNEQSFDDYFKDWNSIDSIEKCTNNENSILLQFDSDTSDETLQEALQGYQFFSTDFKEKMEKKKLRSLFKFFIQSAQYLASSDELVDVTENFGITNFDIHGDTISFLVKYGALATLTKSKKEESCDVQLNTEQILQSSNGIVAFEKFIREFSKCDLAKNFPNIFNNELNVLKLIYGLGGGNHAGPDGFIRIVLRFVEYQKENPDNAYALGDAVVKYTYTNEIDINAIVETFNSLKPIFYAQPSIFKLNGVIRLNARLQSPDNKPFLNITDSVGDVDGATTVGNLLLFMDTQNVPINDTLPSAIYSYLTILEHYFADVLYEKYLPADVKKTSDGSVDLIATIKEQQGASVKIGSSKDDIIEYLHKKMPIVKDLLNDLDEVLEGKLDEIFTQASRTYFSKIKRWLKANKLVSRS